MRVLGARNPPVALYGLHQMGQTEGRVNVNHKCEAATRQGNELER